jgi:hypothetical protein
MLARHLQELDFTSIVWRVQRTITPARASPDVVGSGVWRTDVHFYAMRALRATTIAAVRAGAALRPSRSRTITRDPCM